MFNSKEIPSKVASTGYGPMVKQGNVIEDISHTADLMPGSLANYKQQLYQKLHQQQKA